jgi:hypothetical protein
MNFIELDESSVPVLLPEKKSSSEESGIISKGIVDVLINADE